MENKELHSGRSARSVADEMVDTILKKKCNQKNSLLKRIIGNKNSIVPVFLVFAAALLIFPPFVYNFEGYFRVYEGHHFIFTPPVPMAYIDLIRITVYLALAAIVCAAWYIAISAREKSAP
jgi:hypothetical protein